VPIKGCPLGEIIDEVMNQRNLLWIEGISVRQATLNWSHGVVTIEKLESMIVIVPFRSNARAMMVSQNRTCVLDQ
jgi:hypothetical protein